MRIGVPKEIKIHEYRVGLTPASVAELVSNGHRVLVEQGAGVGSGLPDDASITDGLDALLFGTGDQQLDLQYVRLGCHAGIASVRHDRAIRLRSLNWRIGRLSRGFRDKQAPIGIGDRGRQVLADERSRSARKLGAYRRRRRGRSQRAVEHGLVNRQRSTKVVHRIGMIQRSDGEVRRGELALCEQRAEDKHRLIAALPRLDQVDSRKVSGPGHRRAALGGTLVGGGCRGIGVIRARAGDRVGQGQGNGRLCRGGRGPGHEHGQKPGGRSYDHR